MHYDVHSHQEGDVMEQMSKGRREIAKARSMVVQQQSFFGPLVLQQNVIETTAVKTTATDGDNFYFNPEWAATERPEYLRFAVAANGMTAGLRHPWRAAGRDPKKWNIASDAVVNIVLADSGFQIPQSAKYNPNYKGLSAEQIYALLEREEQEEKKEQQQGNSPGGNAPPDDGDGDGQAPDYGGGGSIIDAPKTSKSKESEGRWQSRVLQAGEMARSRGTLPGEIDRLLAGMRKPSADWRELLWRYLTAPAGDDQSWSRVNRRFVAQGLYLPGMYSEGSGSLALIVDASGSMPQKALDQSLAEIRAIAESLDAELDVIVHDVGVVAFYEAVQPNQEIKVIAGGGTSFVHAAEWVARKDYHAAVWFTDLYVGETDMAAACKLTMPLVWMDYAPYAGKVVPVSCIPVILE